MATAVCSCTYHSESVLGSHCLVLTDDLELEHSYVYAFHDSLATPIDLSFDLFYLFQHLIDTPWSTYMAICLHSISTGSTLAVPMNSYVALHIILDQFLGPENESGVHFSFRFDWFEKLKKNIFENCQNIREVVIFETWSVAHVLRSNRWC